MIFSSLSGNLQRPKEVFEAGLRGRVLRPRQHGHHGRLVHTQRHQRRRGWAGFLFLFLFMGHIPFTHPVFSIAVYLQRAYPAC